mgnify:CR=1 FL=1
MRTAVMIVFILTTASLAQAPDQFFQQALLKENGEGDPAAAAAIYEKIAGDETAGRALRAKAQLHIGICWEKMGKSEAGKAYQEVITRFPEQEEVAAAAKEKLRALRKDADESKIFYPPYQELIKSEQKVWGIAFSPNGKWMAVGSEDKIWLHDIGRIQNRTLLLDGLARERHNLSWSPKGHYVSYTAKSQDGDQTALYSVRVDQGLGKITDPQECLLEKNGFHCYDWQDDESEIAFCSNYPGAINLFSLSEHKITWSRLYDSFIYTIKWGGNPNQLYFVINDSTYQLTTRVLDTATGRENMLLRGQLLFDFTSDRRFGALFSQVKDGKRAYLGLHSTEKNQIVHVSLPEGAERPHLGCFDSGARHFVVPAFTEIGEIIKYDRTNKSLSVVTPPDGYFHFPLVSPDGRFLLYGQYTEDKNLLHIQDLVQGSTRVIPVDNMFGWPSWSADGRFIAYQGRDNINQGWRTKVLDLSTLQTVALDVSENLITDWSPQKTFFSSTRELNGEKQVMINDPGGMKKVLAVSRTGIDRAGWNRKNGWLVYTISDSNSTSVMTADPASGERHLYFKSAASIQNPRLSHDGTHIAYTTDNQQQLRVVRLDGTEDRLVSKKQGHYFSSNHLWLTDDSAIIDQLITDERECYIAQFNLSDSSETLLTNHGRKYITTLALSPDGSALYFDSWHVADATTLYQIDLAEVWDYFDNK